MEAIVVQLFIVYSIMFHCVSLVVTAFSELTQFSNNFCTRFKSVYYIASRIYQFCWRYARILVWKTWSNALNQLRDYSYGCELDRFARLAHLGEMIFTSRVYGVLYLSSIKKFVQSKTSLNKDCLIKQFLQ